MSADKQNSGVSRPLLNIPGSVKKKKSLEAQGRKTEQHTIEKKIELPIAKELQVRKSIGNRSPICKELVPLDFNGLRDRLNFRLLKNIGNKIEVKVRCDENNEKVIVGKIQEVGTDFIGVLQKRKVIVTILWENIREICFKDGDIIVIDQIDAEEVI
ncbi:hypothetical protein KQI67_25180 [Bacillus albus]|uniref:hypothetical protein n=1 Tax=Bacillus albus TaxID=2026189 RepID=UPI001C10E8C9|nr:hypothetical protein [Bacillus albus]MBU5219897.1 hypothetical protein [Bacillus albus]